jgi:DNA-directed RNA polymerase subunit RPC12/RpoP
MEPVTWLMLLGAAAVIVGLIFVRKQSNTKGRWGLGAFRGTDCPRCGEKLPMMRKPASSGEAMWGGWTCPKCGCKVDKYGQERAPS